MTDAEMITLAALANCEAVQMSGDNQLRLVQGYSPAWCSGCGMLPASQALYDELQKRGLLC